MAGRRHINHMQTRTSRPRGEPASEHEEGGTKAKFPAVTVSCLTSVFGPSPTQKATDSPPHTR